MSRIISPEPSLLIGFAGAVAMAAAMGFGRFFFTPVLPGMMSGIPLSAAEAGLIAGGNFAGYLAGALLASQGWAAGRERLLSLCGLFATALLLAAMAATVSLPFFILIRFCAGLASAFAMIFTSSIVLPYAVGRSAVQSVHFGGVGLGIALSSIVAFLIQRAAGDAAHGWRLDWVGGAMIVLCAALFVARHLPKPVQGRQASPEPPMTWTRPLVLLTVSYGLFGFGYVVTATFLVAIVRMAAAGAAVEAGAWLVTGLAAACALFLWQPIARRLGLGLCYLLCLLLEAGGVFASVLLPPVSGALLGGLLLGLTFMTVTAYGLQIARALAPSSPRRALALMTAAFGTGQIVGPLVAGWATEWSGSFTLASVLAAIVLLLSAVLMMPVLRHS
ncbi:YbfB/YjiJ family MFS transporter [Allorhizobium pseudoryzae]|uniref:YbfB/YjiJ family MFS transporter n=1 Tax=Allorhizobium pseudoryzae TaxID=379684 RepID=UPI003D048236